MSRVFWDTNIFIYLFEDQGSRGKEALRLRERMMKRGDLLLTSAMSVGEILVKPREKNDWALAQQYEEAIAATSLVLPFDLKAARTYADLRQIRGLRAPDAIQLSCAAVASTDVFVTNDDRLHGIQVSGIHFIVPMERVPL